PLGTTQFIDSCPDLGDPDGTQANTAAGFGISTAPTVFQLGNWYNYERGSTGGLGFVASRIYPKYMEIYQNRMFITGSTLSPSTVYFINLANPEEYDVENNFEVRTNDGDVVT